MPNVLGGIYPVRIQSVQSAWFSITERGTNDAFIVSVDAAEKLINERAFASGVQRLEDGEFPLVVASRQEITMIRQALLPRNHP